MFDWLRKITHRRRMKKAWRVERERSRATRVEDLRSHLFGEGSKEDREKLREWSATARAEVQARRDTKTKKALLNQAFPERAEMERVTALRGYSKRTAREPERSLAA